jgi:hypothetical protein
MKKLLAILTVSLASLAAFAQGKILFGNDSLHLVYYTVVWPDDLLSFQAVDSAHMPPGINFVADLYIGTDSSSLSFISSTTFSSTPGEWNRVSVIVPGIPGGTSVFVIAEIRDDAYPPESILSTFPISQGVYGLSQEFTFTLGGSIVYPPMWGLNGNWPPGTYNLDYYGAGFRGAIAIGIIPEPSNIALFALGSAAMLISHRKSSHKNFHC